MIELSRYSLEVLRNDKELNLYRGSSGYGHPQILVLSPAVEYPAPETLRRLEHEYALREELDPSWAARPIEMTHYWDRTVLVLDDPGGVPLSRLLGQGLDLAFWLRLAVSLSGVIDRLHQRGIIHKDIKPANVLADPVSSRCWLKGFGIASRLPRERQSAEPPELVAGTLAYMAPEQTGRMNRSIDSRSDLYSLGVTMYEVLTGTLPFTASDPMEWVHCHIARQPVSPSERFGGVPAAVSAIIMKLLAKTAEERYQTATGAEIDFQRCLTEWERGTAGTSFGQAATASNRATSDKSAGLSSAASARDEVSPARLSDSTEHAEASSKPYQIQEFPLGEHDVPDRLLIPEKLYGRAREIDILLTSFDRVVTSGNPELVLVSGYSGIGKSSVVNELHKVLVPPRGLFAAGKFDQYKRDIPYSTLAQAFQGLTRQLLCKNESELSQWREAFREALGPNGQLIVDLIPELGLIIGQQLPVPELAPQDSQRRFQLVFRRFISVFARPEHPLALFLDDLQWLDAASLDLLADLATHVDVQQLLLLGAYRDNEVDSSHPLMRRLGTIRQAGAKVQEIILAPLTVEDLAHLIADSLHGEPESSQARERIAALAQLVHGKTGGNPFFAIQFISELAEEELVTFDRTQGIWSWDLNRIQAKGYTDNVVDLMVGKLSRLPEKTQKTLRELACLGNSAEIASLAVVHGTSEDEVHSDLWEALRLEFVLRSDGAYHFAHDRIQEAVYSAIPKEARAEAHLRVGRLLTKQTPPEKREETTFEIVNQLNRGAALISSPDEREQLAELNLMAGKRARVSTAYRSALGYFIAGAALLPSDCWTRRHELAFDLEFYRAECEFLTGKLAAAEDRLARLSSQVTTLVERATVECLRIDLYITLDQTDQAINACIGYLRHLGLQWSSRPTAEEARNEYHRIWAKLNGRTIEELIDLPLMTDQVSLATLEVLTRVFPSALATDANLLSMAVCRAVNLSLEQGHGDASCVAYVFFAKIAGPQFGDYQAGFRFGQLGFELVERRGLERFQARTYLWYAQFVLAWTEHVQTSRALIRRALEAANQAGDLTVALYCLDNLNTNFLTAGDPLPETQRQTEQGLEFAERSRFGHLIDTIKIQLGVVQSLRGITDKFGTFDCGDTNEAMLEQRFAANPATKQPECWYWIRKLQTRFFAEDYASAMEAAARAGELLWTSAAMFETAEYHFYAALTRAALCDSGSGDSQADSASEPPANQEALAKEAHLQALTEHRKQLVLWAENCPENFENRVALVSAEIARIEGREVAAERLYENAIQSARSNGFVHNEALSNELAARFYLARRFSKIANVYLRDARYGYLRWGADAKVRQLDERYPQLRVEEPLPGPGGMIGATVEHLDLATVLKVSQAVSSEIVFEKLIDTLMRTAIEHAGAGRGLLILPRDVEQWIEAEATTSGDAIGVRLRREIVSEVTAPVSIVHYVMRTQDSVILDDASAQNAFSFDPYIRRHRTRSILCIPLINQAKLIGLLYLENSLTSHVFTPARLNVLKLLASQAAISLENTRLYRDLEKREAKIRRLVDANVMGIYIWNFEGQIIEANEAFLQMVNRSREDLVSGRLNWKDLTPPEWRDVTERSAVQLKATGILQPYEKEYFRNDGGRVPVLVGSAVIEEGQDEGVSFVLDLSEQKRAERALQKAQTELAHASRVMTMGELTASIAHEINQPISAIITNANVGLRWLLRDTPDLEEAIQAIRRIGRDGRRAAEVVSRMRALFQKAPTAKEPLEIKDVIQEVLTLTQNELQRYRVSVRTQFANDLPRVTADRIQLQQVILNLVVNAIQAMTALSDGPCELELESKAIAGIDLEGTEESGPRTDSTAAKPLHVLVAIKDSGPGLDPELLDRLFDPFFSTKPQGLGIGLTISRSIIEAHSGRLWAKANTPRGAIFQFTLPI